MKTTQVTIHVERSPMRRQALWQEARVLYAALPRELHAMRASGSLVRMAVIAELLGVVSPPRRGIRRLQHPVFLAMMPPDLAIVCQRDLCTWVSEFGDVERQIGRCAFGQDYRGRPSELDAKAIAAAREAAGLDYTQERTATAGATQRVALVQKLQAMVLALPKRGFDPFKRQLAEIVVLREALGISIDELSAMAIDKQLSATTLRRIEAGKNTHDGVDDDELASEIAAARKRLREESNTVLKPPSKTLPDLAPVRQPEKAAQLPLVHTPSDGPKASDSASAAPRRGIYPDGTSKRSSHRLREDPGNAALYTVDDVARLLGTTPRQVRNMRSRGMLPPAVKWPGLGVRWMPEEFHTWVREVGSTSERD